MLRPLPSLPIKITTHLLHFIVAALRIRRAAMRSPLIFISCLLILLPFLARASDSCSKQSFGSNPFQTIINGAQSAFSHVDQAFDLARSLSSQQGYGLENAAVQDCMELLDDMKDQLNNVIFQLSSFSPRSVLQQLSNMKIWVSTALSYQTSCADGFYDENGDVYQSSGFITSQMLATQADVSNFMTNVLRLVAQLSNIGKYFPPLPSRKLLHEALQDEDGFPEWVLPADRKLLQAPSPASSSGYNAVVAADGSGQYSQIQNAVDNIPEDYSGRYVIYIKSGVYNEIVSVSKKLQNITFLGDGIGNTIITGSRNVALQNYTTFRSATVAISGQRFIARGITFRNTAGPSGHQAVAVRAGADYVVFESCSFESYQDTLYALSSRQFYKNCKIYGTVDFIFGNAAAIFQNCELQARKPLQGQQNTYTAHGRKVDVDPTGFSFQNCTVTAADDLKTSNYTVPTFLGRPWKPYSRTVFLKSYLDKVIEPAGWLAWNESQPFENTLYYGEYQNTGPGSPTGGRVTWPGVHSQMSFQEAVTFNVENFISGTTWLPQANVMF